MSATGGAPSKALKVCPLAAKNYQLRHLCPLPNSLDGTRQQMFSHLFDTVGNSHRGITNKCGYPCFKERILNGLNFLLDQIIISILSTR